MLIIISYSACRNTFACLELPLDILTLWNNASDDPTNQVDPIKDDIMDMSKKDYMCIDNQRCKDFGDYFNNVMGPPL